MKNKRTGKTTNEKFNHSKEHYRSQQYENNLKICLISRQIGEEDLSLSL